MRKRMRGYRDERYVSIGKLHQSTEHGRRALVRGAAQHCRNDTGCISQAIRAIRQRDVDAP
eukprot:5124822-Pyramimonas_sp.AAC.1